MEQLNQCSDSVYLSDIEFQGSSFDAKIVSVRCHLSNDAFSPIYRSGSNNCANNNNLEDDLEKRITFNKQVKKIKVWEGKSCLYGFHFSDEDGKSIGTFECEKNGKKPKTLVLGKDEELIGVYGVR